MTDATVEERATSPPYGRTASQARQGPEGTSRPPWDATDIDQRDYEEPSLDDLIVRLVAEELAALDGTTDAEP